MMYCTSVKSMHIPSAKRNKNIRQMRSRNHIIKNRYMTELSFAAQPKPPMTLLCSFFFFLFYTKHSTIIEAEQQQLKDMIEKVGIANT